MARPLEIERARARLKVASERLNLSAVETLACTPVAAIAAAFAAGYLLGAFPDARRMVFARLASLLAGRSSQRKREPDEPSCGGSMRAARGRGGKDKAEKAARQADAGKRLRDKGVRRLR